jgi:N-methylhydantoinase B
MASKMVGLKIKKGERLRLETPGGGGYGDPQARSSEATERDLRLGYATKGGAA